MPRASDDAAPPPRERPGVAVATVGCRLNQAETDELLETLAARGVALRPEDADLAVVNTCAVTRDSAATSRKVVRRTVQRHPDAFVVVTGCLASAGPEALADLDGVDLVVGNDAKTRLADLALGAGGSASLAAAPPPARSTPGDVPARGAPPPARPTRTRLHTRVAIRAQTGCDEHCAFCIVPQTRGELQSRSSEDIVAAIRRRVAEGVREVVLTGVHLGKYGVDDGQADGLAALVERVLDRVADLERVRLSSVLPLQVTPRLVALMAGSERVCNHLHVPLQSGSDRVLAAMGRGYDAATFLERVAHARQRIPGLGLSTDLIVGFPTETAHDHADTLAVVDQAGFSKLHVFRYSPRPGTRAAELADTVPAALKKQRSADLVALGERLRDRFHTSLLGTVLETVVEIDRGDGWLQGTADNYVKATFRGPAQLVEQRVAVRVEGLRGAGVQGVAVGVRGAADGR